MNKRYVSENIVKKDCTFRIGTPGDEAHFLFHCPVYSAIRYKHNDCRIHRLEGPSTLKTLLEFPSAPVSIKVAMYDLYGLSLKLREEGLT